MIKLLCSCNPNTIEILGLKPEHYLYSSPIGQLLLDNRKIFLSQRASFTFGAYASSQLRRLENKSARLVSQSQQEKNILKSILKLLISCIGALEPRDCLAKGVETNIKPKATKKLKTIVIEIPNFLTSNVVL